MSETRPRSVTRLGRRLRPVKSIGRGMSLLDALAENPTGLGVSELAAAAGFSKTATYNLITTLESGGLIRRDGENRYQLGWRLLELGEIVRRHSTVGEIARPHLIDLAERVGETAMIVILDGDTTFCLERAESRRSEATALSPGRRASVDADAAGAVLVAHASPRRRRRFMQEQLGDLPATELFARAERIRSQGYAISLQDDEPDSASIGVPVFQAGGEVVAALAVVGPRTRLTAGRIEELVPEVSREGAAVSAALGFAGNDMPAEFATIVPDQTLAHGR